MTAKKKTRLQVIHNPAANAPCKIVTYLHCGQCLAELPEGKSPQEWASNETGITSDGGIQIWCKRHDMNVTHCTFSIVDAPPRFGQSTEHAEKRKRKGPTSTDPVTRKVIDAASDD